MYIIGNKNRKVWNDNQSVSLICSVSQIKRFGTCRSLLCTCFVGRS